MALKGEVLLAHGPQPRQRFSLAEKMALVEESSSPGMSVSAVARKNGISPSQLFGWRKLMKDVELRAIESQEELVTLSEMKALRARVRELDKELEVCENNDGQYDTARNCDHESLSLSILVVADKDFASSVALRSRILFLSLETVNMQIPRAR